VAVAVEVMVATTMGMAAATMDTAVAVVVGVAAGERGLCLEIGTLLVCSYCRSALCTMVKFVDTCLFHVR
jgi:hypothetical protein